MFTMKSKKQPPEVFYKKAVLENFSILTAKYLRSSVFLIKLGPFRSVWWPRGAIVKFRNKKLKK